MNEREEMKVTCIEPDQQALVTLANIEYRISIHMQGTYREILAVGRCLVEAKEAGLVPHGQWEDWVRRNTGMSERQAQRLMQAARNVQTGSAMESLPISKIQVILSLPEPEREAMAEQAASEDMSLRELQEEVRRQKQLADEANERARRSEISRANTVEKLRAELAAAQQAPAAGISPEAQAEIDRLKGELADAEAYAEQQAEQRQQAQREMLAMQTQAARGELDTAGNLNSFDIAAAVRTFIGAAGVLIFVGQAFIQLLMLMFLADTIEYGQWKTGKRNESVTFSIQPLINKIGGAIASGIVSVTLVISGINAANSAADVTPEGLLIMKLAMLVLPLLCILAGYLVYRSKYKIDAETYRKIVGELHERGDIRE